jgi:hypothetical protein
VNLSDEDGMIVLKFTFIDDHGSIKESEKCSPVRFKIPLLNK